MIEKKLKQYFGFDGFLNGQKEVVEKIIDGKSTAAIFPTGAGKSICYQLPALMLPHLTLVVSPLLSLMKDQLDFLKSHNIPAARLDSTLDKKEYEEILNQAKTGELKILMISVERFKNERFRNKLSQMKISLLVIDEAHCISEWGHNFRPEYLKIPTYKEEFKIPQILLLTATATKEVVDDMSEKLKIKIEDFVITGFYRKNLFLQVTPSEEHKKNENLLKMLSRDKESSTIIYVTLQKTAEIVAKFLASKGINARAYHAGMKNDERERIQNQFMNNRIPCIVATIAFGMGIDKKDIRRVIHYDMPKSIENYSQEIGRSGRDGNYSFCEVLANRDNINVLENFVYGDTPDKTSIRKLIEIIDNEDDLLKVKFLSLSKELNIRSLPLKTLFVYLDMENVIKPKYTYFEDYSFKYIEGKEKIIDRFKGERREFIENLFESSTTKKIWTYIDVSEIVTSYNTDRKRIVSALEYFNEKEWISLEAKSTIDVYEIIDKSIEVEELTEKLYDLFKNKEKHEISRIHNMIGFFENEDCLSRILAEYFNEVLEFDNCGHCSSCNKEKVEIKSSLVLQSIDKFDFHEIYDEFLEKTLDDFSINNFVKFLCGIYMPLFGVLKLRKLNFFGRFEKYPYIDVYNWVEKNLN